MLIDYETLGPDRYKVMSQTIIPRPIAWVVTRYGKTLNIAPFSYFIGLSSNPPTLLISVGHKRDGTPKDTLNNLRDSKKATICMVAPEHLESMHLSSKELERNISEQALFEIPTQTLNMDYPPIVVGTPTAFFCDLHQEIALKGSKTIPLILEIKAQYIDDACITDKERLSISFSPVARVGKGYVLLGEPIDPPNIL